MITFLVCLALLVTAYFTYGRYLERLVGIDPAARTPCSRLYDGVDYVPLPRWRIFLIQLLNIAGLGPIFGAVLGAAYGPVAFLWITFGGIFMGAAHDFIAGVISLRHDGASLPETAGVYLGGGMKIVMRLFSAGLMILVGAVFLSQPASLVAARLDVPSLEGIAFGGFSWLLLIVLGGIGFLTWDDVWENRLHIRRYRMQSKVILVTTVCLILLPALFFFLADYSALPIGKRLLASFFQAVSPRTAGFNTMDLTAMTEASRAMMILLMLVGGSPGSTAGGMKTTTLAVLLANAVATFRRRESPQFFGRRVGSGAVKTAATILSMYLMLFFGCGLFISSYEALPLSTCLYETASAVGTVGLTLGITPQLHLPSQLLLILLMYLGRVGGLTLVYAAMSSREPSVAKLPLEKITVG